MKRIIFELFLLIGTQLATVWAGAGDCPLDCSVLQCDTNPWCSSCDFCVHRPPICESWCMKYMCGYPIDLCSGCEFCKIPEGQNCDPECLYSDLILEGKWGTQSGALPKWGKPCSDTESCGGCIRCRSCESWCSPLMCGIGAFCDGCEFCEGFEEKPDCQKWCSDFDSNENNPHCNGCPWSKQKPKRCDNWCMTMSCGSASCEDCEFCQDRKICNAFCNAGHCGVKSNIDDGNPLRVGDCDDCDFCKAKEEPPEKEHPNKGDGLKGRNEPEPKRKHMGYQMNYKTQMTRRRKLK